MANLGDFTSKIPGGSTAPTGQDTLKLLVNGKSYEGWQQITVKRSIKAISGSFDLAVVDRWAEEQVSWPIAMGDKCKVMIGQDTIVTGYIDTVEPSFDKGTRGIKVTGRDMTADFVDCSVEQIGGTWYNLSLLSLARRLASPFGIGVKQTFNSGLVYFKWTFQQSESAFENLEKAARLSSALLMNDGQGNILITRTGTKRASTAIIQGKNILSAGATFSMKERFSKYIVKAQNSGYDQVEPAVDFRMKGIALDKGVKRYRPILVLAESAVSQALANERAKWEASVRLGRSISVDVTVPGWRQGDGRLWQLNEITRLTSPWLGMDGDLLITDITFSKGDEGTTTRLKLEPPSAYTPDPTIKDKWKTLVREDSRK